MNIDAKALRIVFMGTPEFAVASLRALKEEGYNIVGVITAPDKPAGRGQKLSISAVKQYAVAENLKVLQPERLKDPQFLEQLASLRPDLQIVVAFRMLPELVWQLPPLGTFNLHASLLPQYRGAAPINWAVMNGEVETGLTTFLLTHEIDTGQILFQERYPIHYDDTAGDVYARLMNGGASLVLHTVNALAAGTIVPKLQEVEDAAALCAAPKLHRDTLQINWNRSAKDVRNHIRGLSPYPGAWTLMADVGSSADRLEIKIYQADLVEHPLDAPGSVQTDGKIHLYIACSDGWLSVNELQLAGKRRMHIAEVLRGFSGFSNSRFI